MDQWDGKHYKKHGISQEASALEIIENITLQGYESILDIGSGDGKVTAFLAKKVPTGKVIGIDFSPSMIQQSLSEFSHIPNLQFFQKNAESFHFDEKFDLITSFTALHWIKDHLSVLKNAHSVLKKGGKIVFSMISGGNQQIGEVFAREPWQSLIQREKKRNEKEEEKYANYTESDYSNLLKQTSFIKECIETQNQTYEFPNIEALTQHFMTWVPFFINSPQDLSLQLSRELAENIALHQKKQINLRLNSSRLYVEARKDS